MEHLLISANWDGDDRVRCLCSWHTDPGPGALERWLEHVASREEVDA